MIIRLLDITLALTGLTLLFPLIIALYIIGLFDTGSSLFVQKRIGKRKKLFKLLKFRTMNIGTPQVGTHLAASNDITFFGHFLRKNKLDELPQLINVVKGDMSIVGPRPGLPNQKKLFEERNKRKVFDVRPGITGLAQVNEVDMSTPRKLARYDDLMIKNFTICLYIKIILNTALGKGGGDRVKK